jgi:kynureninase
VAGAYVNARYREAFDLPRLAGWWGHDKVSRFQMGPHFQPMSGAAGWQLSNPPILSTAPLAVSLDLYLQAGLKRFRAKSEALTGFAHAGITNLLHRDVHCITPRNPMDRGCQLSLRVTGGPQRARRVFNSLSDRGVIGDWREPDVIRIAPHPLYNSFADVSNCVTVLKETVACC